MTTDYLYLLLKKSYPMVGGLQVTTKGEVLSFDVETGEFVQILNISGVHWIMILTTGCLPGEVNVFDSMPFTDLPKRAKKQIALFYVHLSINLF